jgi:hypothetical protein
MKRFNSRYRCRETRISKRSIGGKRSNQAGGGG